MFYFVMKIVNLWFVKQLNYVKTQLPSRILLNFPKLTIVHPLSATIQDSTSFCRENKKIVNLRFLTINILNRRWYALISTRLLYFWIKILPKILNLALLFINLCIYVFNKWEWVEAIKQIWVDKGMRKWCKYNTHIKSSKIKIF